MKRIAKTLIFLGATCCFSGVSGTTFAQVRNLPPRAPQVAAAQHPVQHPVQHSVPPPVQPILQATITPRGIHQGMQTVRFRLPQGALYSFAIAGQFTEPVPADEVVALHVGAAYRFRISNIPFSEHRELYPSIRLLGRIHPPPGRETRFPIVVDITQEDLELAMNGKLVTRVVYLEDPARALPLNVKDGPISQDVAPGANPFVIAETLGRPIALIQLGTRVPDENGFYGSPEWQFLGEQ